MARFLVYRTMAGGSLGSDDSVARYEFYNESDVKTGLVSPRSNPLLMKGPESEITAANITEARLKFAEKAAHAFG